ncbi:MAG: PilT/PilU family type 4a pilus ATPase [Kiritimatiellae bacterium]|nr:PilT/PilU family type 4a pilus ATPase [Kiritimatiellia bacterium]
MSNILENLFALTEEFGASDLHLNAGFAPRFRIDGKLIEKGDIKPYDMKAVDSIAMELGLYTLPAGCPDGTERIRMTLLKNGSIDGALTSPTGARFRFNIFRAFDRHSVALRRIDSTMRSFAELGLPQRVAGLAAENDGLVIVTGPTGSGKSTTLATMIDEINTNRCGHIITIEDPIEYIHKSKKCFVNQRQVGRDVSSFNDAVVDAMRQDPDVILIGEMRDISTVRTALRAAETGHLVLATLHASDSAGAVERLVAVFPPEEQNSIRHQLSLVLKGVLAQHLLPSLAGEGRCVACELLINTTAAANLIATGRSQQLYSVIETGAQQGMRTLDKSLAELITSGRIDERVARSLSKNPDMLKGRLEYVER